MATAKPVDHDWFLYISSTPVRAQAEASNKFSFLIHILNLGNRGNHQTVM